MQEQQNQSKKKKIGPYKFIKKIGKGSFATVF